MKYSTFRWNGTTQPLERIDEAVRNHKPPRGISQPLHNGEGMACRRIVTAKHQAVARLLVDGESGYRALRQCGYSHYSARDLGLVLRHSWGLRQAILEANAHPETNVIHLHLGSGPQTIALTAPLPAITTPITIDGTTQPGYRGTPVVE